MDFAKIKNLVKGNGDKLILVENGEPEAVVMSFAEYEKMTSGETDDSAREKSPRISGYPAEPHEMVRVKEAALSEDDFMPHAAIAVSDAFLRPEEIRLEDLPL